MLRVCKTAYAEANPILYLKNFFTTLAISGNATGPCS